MTRKLLVGFLMVFCAVTAAQADYLIQLKSGVSYEVGAYREERGMIWFTLHGGEVGVPKQDVSRITPLAEPRREIRLRETPQEPVRAPAPEGTGEPSASTPAAPAPGNGEVGGGKEEGTRDTEPPRVVSTSPKDGEMLFAQMFQYPIPISVTFSEPMDQKSVEEAFQIDPPEQGTVAWSGNSVTFTPSTWSLSFQTTVTVGTGAKDQAGNPLAAPFTFSFGKVLPGR
ncbi:MAG: Ig-like domain-containing protein [Nitrospirae bacterium]|nr:Ig-like domain-containing protein [Nitrospirota bacterium]